MSSAGYVRLGVQAQLCSTCYIIVSSVRMPARRFSECFDTAHSRYAHERICIAYPWRAILENTIGSGGQTAEARVASFKQANVVLSQLIDVLQDQDEYPSISDMENKLINCDTTGTTESHQHLTGCAS